MIDSHTLSEDEVPRIVIVADDLSSATDCGVQMASGGYRTVVPLQPAPARLSGVDIAAFDTDSRTLSGELAYAATRDCLARQRFGPRTVFYKSMDSTLRGNLGAEIDAILADGSFDAAAVAPAFPTYGRTTCGGRQHVNGTPVHETEFGSDPTTPVRTSSVSERIAEQCARRTALVPLAISRRGPGSIRRCMSAALAEGVELLIFDAAEETDLANIATTLGALALRTLWVGSTGLSRYVPAAIGLHPRACRTAFEVSEGHVLIVAGSASETTRRQLDACARHSGFAEIRVDTRALVRGGRDAEAEHQRARRLLTSALEEQHGTLALTLTSTRAEVAETQAIADERGMAREQVAVHLEKFLAKLIVALVERGTSVKGLVVTGGSTAKTLAAQLGAELIEVLDEIEPGIPLGRLGGGYPMLIVTKAGGFGSEASLVKAADGIRAYGYD